MPCSLKTETRRYRRVLKTVALLFALALASLHANAESAPKARFVKSKLTVKDNVTGLVWTRNGNPAGQKFSWHDAFRSVSILNEQQYAGHSDWRVPDIDELKKLASTVQENGAESSEISRTPVSTALIQAGFYGVQAGDYWSSSTSMFNNMEARFINMISGEKSFGSKALYMHVWPVRWDGIKKQKPEAASGRPADLHIGTGK